MFLIYFHIWDWKTMAFLIKINPWNKTKKCVKKQDKRSTYLSFLQDKRSTYYATVHSCAFAVFYKQSPIVNYRFNHNNTITCLLSLRMVCRQGRTAWFCVTSQTRQNGSSRETSSPPQVGMVSLLKLNAEWGPKRYKKYTF